MLDVRNRGTIGQPRRGEQAMKNVELNVEGTMLTIKVDLSKEFGPSASGKTIIIASTEGNVTVPNRQEKIGLNVYRKK
jgi:NAD(P)-dependent dehydrogenase (short-subunit alcohol dehydrogenase family)